MPRYFIEVSYQGTNFSGFQIQENAPTIQLQVGLALKILMKEDCQLTGSSRTDAGVHAHQNFFHFDTDFPIQPNHVYNINAILPPSIAVKGIYRVANDAHCRFDALSREYRYYLYPKKNPFLLDRAWLYPYPIHFSVLQDLAKTYLSYQDFTSFAKKNTQVHHFNCQIFQSEWVQESDSLVYHVAGNRFLRGMVRAMVGTMLQLSKHPDPIIALKKVLAAKDPRQADFSTPAHGLFLHRVNYPAAHSLGMGIL